MPVIDTPSRQQGNEVATDFISSITSLGDSFYLPGNVTSDYLRIDNLTTGELYVTVGTQTDVLIEAFESASFTTETFTEFSIRAAIGMGSFRARVSHFEYDETDEKKLGDSIKDFNNRVDVVSKDMLSRSINIMFPPAPLVAAKGDGATDDTAAFNGAYEYISSQLGSGIIFADGKFSIEGSILLKPNVHLELSPGSIMTKENATTNFYMFTALSKGQKGYGSGTKNNRFKGGTYYGGFDAGKSLSFTLHHAQDLLFEDVIFEECNTVGHTADLTGCKGVTFRRCIFKGYSMSAGREYTEAIQLDYSSKDSISSLDTAGSYDGLPTIDVTVEDCKFIPVYNADGSIKYPAPNPIGSHSLVEGQYYKNIKFIRNTVIDAPVSNVAGSYVPGWLHFLTADGGIIEDNHFESTLSAPVTVVGFYALTNEKALADVENSNANVTANPRPCKNFTVRRNKFKGFNSKTAVDLIHAWGTSYNSVNYNVDNIKIDDNEFENCYTKPDSGYDGSSIAISVKYFNKTFCRRNKAKDVRRLLNVEYGEVADLNGNEVDGGHYVPVLVNTVKTVSINNNKIKNYRGGLYLPAVTRLTFNDNHLSDDLTGAAGTFPQAVAFSGVTGLIAKNNQIYAAAGTDLPNGFRIYNTTTQGVVADNIISGFATPVSKDAGSAVTVGTNY